MNGARAQPHKSFFGGHIHPIFVDVSLTGLELVDWLGWAKPQGSACLHPLYPAITSACHHTQIFFSF